MCGSNGHPEVVEAVAGKRNQYPCDKVPHRLIEGITVALEGDVSLQRKIDALCEEGAKPVADCVAEAAADDYSARCVIVYRECRSGSR